VAQIGAPAVEPLIEVLLTGNQAAATLAGESLEAIGSPAVPGLVKALGKKK